MHEEIIAIRISVLGELIRQHFDVISQDVPEETYLVGGAVRDAILDVESHDYDFVVVGETPESMEDRGFELIAASSFPVFHDDESHEYALARTENKTGAGYKGFEVETEDVSLEDDLERRDLTMNAIALDPSTGKLIDPHDGIEDIQNGILRHVSEAFAEDPLRVLRVARYAGRFAIPPGVDVIALDHRFAFVDGNRMQEGFRVDDETERMMRRVAPELNRMSRDRIGTELRKSMEQARRPSRVFEVLEASGALAVIWPELDRATIVPAGRPEHHSEGSVFTHTMLTLDRMHELCDEHDVDGSDRVRRLFMAVAHDLGKVVSADRQGGLHSDDPPTGFAGHAEIGTSVATDTARRLGLPTHIEGAMIDASRHHMRFHDLDVMTPEEMIDFVSEMHYRTDGTPNGATPWELLDLAHADHEGRRVPDGDVIAVPTFDRERMEDLLGVVVDSFRSVDGYVALADGMCDEHESALDDPEDTNFNAVMAQCEDCRTPGSWVGDRVEELQVEYIQDELD